MLDRILMGHLNPEIYFKTNSNMVYKIAIAEIYKLKLIKKHSLSLMEVYVPNNL